MNTECLTENGEAFYEKGEIALALDAFERANELDSSDFLLNYIGCCHIKLGNHLEAIRIFLAILNENQTWERPLLNLARVYFELGGESEAFHLLQRAETLCPESEDVYFYYGCFYEKQGDMDSAIQAYEKSIKINSQEADTHLNVGRCYADKGWYAKALDTFMHAFTLDSTCYDALWNASLTHGLLKEYGSALDCFLKLHEVGYDSEVTLEIAYCLCKLSRFNEARDWAARVPHDPHNSKRLAKLNEFIEKNLEIEK